LAKNILHLVDACMIVGCTAVRFRPSPLVENAHMIYGHFLLRIGDSEHAIDVF